MSFAAFEIVIIILLIIANGVFAMSETAFVSARKVRLQQRANEGDKKAAAALELANSPNRLLSTVQLGITLIGILAGAFGGATIAESLNDLLVQIPFLAQYAHPLSVGIVVVLVTYLSLVIGELVPKQLALRNAERLAVRMAGPLMVLSRLTRPLVRVLDASSNAVLWLMQVKPASGPDVTEEEVRGRPAQATAQGIFEPMEEEIVDQVFRLADRKAGALLVPRTEIVWIDI